MTLAASIANWYHQFTQSAYVDGKPVVVVSGSIDYGYDSVVSAIVLRLKELYAWIEYAKEVTVYLGWDGFTVQAARALLQTKRPDWFPLNNEIQANGYLSRARKPLATSVTYSSQTDTAIVTDLLSKANVPYVDLDGAGTTLATVKSIVVSEQEEPFSVIEAIDKITGYKTFESAPDGVVRRRLITPGIPAAGYAYSYQEGVNETHIRRIETIERILNRTKVTGLAGEGITTTRRADSPYVDRDYTYSYSSDWIQTQAISDSAAILFETENNRAVDELEITTPLDPRVQPGQTCRVLNASINITSWTNYYIKHINHSWGESGAWTRLTVEGGTGQAGYQYFEPEALFEFTVTKEKYDVGGVSTVMYTVACDGSQSFDPDGTIASYAWANSANADTGTSVLYATSFTVAQLAAVPTITLTVTDNDGNTNALTLLVDESVETILTRDLYSAADAQAEATPDCGVTWYTNTIDAQSTPEIAGEGHSYYGLAAGTLYYTADYLVTAPTLVHTFDAAVKCIWINELDADRVVVGLANGKVYATVDASLLAAATWTLLYTAGAAVNWIAESPYQMGQYRLCSSNQVLITFDSFGNVGVLQQWAAGTVQKFALSAFANYACCKDSAAESPVKREDGVAITFADGTVDVRAITHHIRDDVLYCAALDVDGTTCNIYRKAAGATAFSKIATIANAGQPNHMVRDGDKQLEFYLQCNQGLYKSFDGCYSFVRMRNYTGAGLNGLMVGYGSTPWTVIPPFLPGGVLVSSTSNSNWIIYSPNGISDWEERDTGVTEPLTCATYDLDNDFVAGDTVYMIATATHPLVWKTTDLALNWASTGWPGGTDDAVALAANMAVANEVWCGRNGSPNAVVGAYKSTNAGVSWTLKVQQFNFSYVPPRSIKANGLEVWVVFDMGSGNDYFNISHDGGTTWVGGASTGHVLVHVRLARVDNQVAYLFIANNSNWLRVSTNGGASFTDRIIPVTAIVNDVAVHPDGAIVIVATGGRYVYRSTDYGANFTQVLDANGYVGRLAISRDGTRVFTFDTASSNQYAYSTDGGVSWTTSTHTGWSGIAAAALVTNDQNTPVYSDTSWKAKSLWNGASNDAAPTQWQGIAFDDSGWAVAVQDAAPGATIVSGSKAIWAVVPPASNTEQCCLRKTFTGPSEQIQSASLQIVADDTADIWINNMFIGRVTGTGSITTITVDPAIMLSGATNCIAVLAANSAAAHAWVSAKLTVS